MLLLVLLFPWPALAVKLPSRWPRCVQKTEMNDCLKNAIEMAIKDLANGDESLSVLPLDPWRYPLFEYHHKYGPVAMHVIASDTSTEGFKNTSVDFVSTDWEKMEIELSTPHIKIKGKYAMNGTLILFPLSGQGEYSIIFDGFTGILKMFFERYERSGEEYIRVKYATFLPNAEHASINLSNLFNGNEILSERMAALINKNWKFILDTVAPLVSETCGIPIAELCNSIFSRVPLKEFILKKY